jgi:hypothetical protein
MPFPRTWLPNISAIRTTVEAWPTNEFDRDAVAHIFALKRRAALSLMKEIGPIRLRTGRWAVPRERLIGFLLSQTKEADVVLARKEHYTQSLLAADASLLRRPSLLLIPRKLSAKQREVYATGLPDSVTLEPGTPNRLVVEFSTIEELAERLLGTGLALNNRLSFYQDLLEPRSQELDADSQAEREDIEYFKNWRPD